MCTIPVPSSMVTKSPRRTWKSFAAMALPGGLPADGLLYDSDGMWKPTKKTSPTDIAAYIWSTLAAEKFPLRVVEPLAQVTTGSAAVGLAGGVLPPPSAITVRVGSSAADPMPVPNWRSGPSERSVSAVPT